MRSDNALWCVIKVARCLFLVRYEALLYDAKIISREVNLKEKKSP